MVFTTGFDPGNRPVEQKITLPADVPGTNRQTYKYDALNRTTSARNNYAKVDQAYDAFSRLIRETHSIRLDGSGFSNGWEQPIKLVHSYDKQSNRTAYQVVNGRKKDLDVAHTYDALNRIDNISAAYFQKSMQTITGYNYLGPWRVSSKTLGNAAALSCAYDAKRRLRSHQWNGPNRLLAGFEYDYDRMDNALYEGFTHDLGLYDHFQYNDRYEVTGVTYRVPGSIGPITPANAFDYDDVYNRRKATFGGPFDKVATTNDSYAINKVNEYTHLTRNGTITTPAHDRAGNATSFLVQPVTGNTDRNDVMASARWDAFNLLFDIDHDGINPQQDYRYDPFRRRIVTLELNDSDISEDSRRYIYDGWTVVEERLFEKGATLAKAPSLLERIYVNGMQIDEPLLTAIDRNADGKLGDSNSKNVAEPDADQEYYYLNNRLGSIMALLDADNPDRVLEYYRYSIYGEPIVLPVLDGDGDGLEDTPFDLSDNFDLNAEQSPSEFSNPYLFTARRFDDKTGLYYFRNRYLEPRMGRFIGRDPLLYYDSMNFYAELLNNPGGWRDPLGTSIAVRVGKSDLNHVKEALCEICPCLDIEIEKGMVQAKPPVAGSKTSSCKKQLSGRLGRKREYGPGKESFYDCYCRHRAGCNLLLDLVNPEFGLTTILEVKNKDNKRGNRHASNSSTITFNRKRGKSEGKRRPPSIGLAHELIHAHHNHTRRHTSADYPGRRDEEHRTVRAENQIRREMRGDYYAKSSRYRQLTTRTKYKGERVENPEAGDLDDTYRFADFELSGPGGPGWRPSRMGNWIPY